MDGTDLEELQELRCTLVVLATVTIAVLIAQDICKVVIPAQMKGRFLVLYASAMVVAVAPTPNQ